tara:strand:- start:552 stop:671 length:120 start_codon:yes stop_codon:yes gene_type:complete
MTEQICHYESIQKTELKMSDFHAFGGIVTQVKDVCEKFL